MEPPIPVENRAPSSPRLRPARRDHLPPSLHQARPRLARVSHPSTRPHRHGHPGRVQPRHPRALPERALADLRLHLIRRGDGGRRLGSSPLGRRIARRPARTRLDSNPHRHGRWRHHPRPRRLPQKKPGYPRFRLLAGNRIQRDPKILMKTFVALLRAVNVGGTGKLPMADLRALCEAEGFTNVRTYIASGNVLFETPASAPQTKAKLENRLANHVGKPVGVILRTADEMAQVLSANPFSPRPATASPPSFSTTRRRPPPSTTSAARPTKNSRSAFARSTSTTPPEWPIPGCESPPPKKAPPAT